MSSVSTLPFSLTREANGCLYVSGQIPIDQQKNIPDGIAAQTQLVMQNIQTILKQHDLSMDNIVAVTAYLTDSADFAAFNTVYASFFSGVLPTRTTVCAGLMVPKAKVEMTVIAA